VERPREHLTIREAVLVVLDSAGGKVDGRTAMQKLAYFAAKSIHQDLGHRAHFYGPYSREVEGALNDSALSEDVVETVQRFPDWNGSGPDIRKYTYEITDQGREFVAALRRSNPELSGQIDDIVRRLLQLVPDQNVHTLSLAAKTDLIVNQQSEPVTTSTLPDLARQLGWKMSGEEVAKAVGVLSSLGTVKTN
jgi:uncharacterized protein YwgA